MITILPPTAPDILLWCGRGVTVTLPTGPFISALRAPEGTPIRLIASRKGFVDVMFDGFGLKDNEPVSLENFPSDAWHKEISADDFRGIDDHDSSLIDHATVRLTDGKWVRSERELSAVEVKVKAAGYETLETRCDLTLPPPYVVSISRRQGREKFPVELDNGRIGLLTIEGVDVSATHPRLKGYQLRDGRLIYNPPTLPDRPAMLSDIPVSESHSRRDSRITFLTGLLTGVLGMLLLILGWLLLT